MSELHPSYWKPGDEIVFIRKTRVGIETGSKYIIIDMVDIYNNRETFDVLINDRFGPEHYRAEDFEFVRSSEDIRNEKIDRIIKC